MKALVKAVVFTVAGGTLLSGAVGAKLIDLLGTFFSYLHFHYPALAHQTTSLQRFHYQ